jgi:hypothetical protein
VLGDCMLTWRRTIMTTPTSQTRTLHYPHEPSPAEV